MRLNVDICESELNSGSSGNLEGEGDMLVVVVVGRVVGRLDSSTGATRTIATSASAEKYYHIEEPSGTYPI